MNAMLMSLWLFSMTFAASATLMDSALYTPASTTSSYTWAISSSVSSSMPETILVIVSRRCARVDALRRVADLEADAAL